MPTSISIGSLIDGVFEAHVPVLAGDLRVAPTGAPFSAEAHGVRFHEARGLSEEAIAAIQKQVRTRVLCLFEVSIPGFLAPKALLPAAPAWAGDFLSLRRCAFERRGLLIPEAVADMRQWIHGGGFSLDAENVSRPRTVQGWSACCVIVPNRYLETERLAWGKTRRR